MQMEDYINEIKLELTGNILQLELPDETLELVVKKAFREVQRYIDSTELMVVPFASCIDLSNSNISSISRIFRTESYNSVPGTNVDSTVDPMKTAQWQILCGGGNNMYNLQDWVMNYASWNTMLQIRNGTSTDLSFKQDKQGKKLYINAAYDVPGYITIEYVPEFKDVDDIKSDYWIDILVRLSIALTKVTLGRIRSRYTQSNALWTQDGDKLLEEGNAELVALRETLRVNSQIIYPID